MKVLILCDHYPISPRVNKMRTSILNLFPHCKVEVFAWNRENIKVHETYVKTFNQNLKYGNGFQKISNLIKFILASRKFIEEFSPTYIHVIDFEMLISSWFMRGEKRIIYEVFDIKFFSNKFLNYIREKMEKNIIDNYIDGIITASPFFKEYYNNILKKPINIITINNKPDFSIKDQPKSNYMVAYEQNKKGKIVIGFIGTVRYELILQNLITAIKNNNDLLILIAGNGPSLHNIKMRITSEGLEEKVLFTGRYSNQDIKSLYEFCDFIWSAYPNKEENVQYAISNKFFESQIFNKKIIVSKNTRLGEYVEKNNLGFAIDPYDINTIKSLLEKLEKKYIYEEKGNIGKGKYWQNEEKELIKVYK